MGVNGLCHSCAHATKCQFASLIPHMRMKIFSCQHVPPQGTREPFVCALLAVPTHNIAEKKKNPLVLLSKQTRFLTAPAKPKLSPLLSEDGEQRGPKCANPHVKTKTRKDQKPRASDGDNLAPRIRTHLYLRHGAAALSLCATQRLPVHEECL